MKFNKLKLVEGWRDGWQWISTWMLSVIIFLTTVPLPPELLIMLPDEIRIKVVGVLALVGLIMRFVKQPNFIQKK